MYCKHLLKLTRSVGNKQTKVKVRTALNEIFQICTRERRLSGDLHIATKLNLEILVLGEHKNERLSFRVGYS